MGDEAGDIEFFIVLWSVQKINKMFLDVYLANCCCILLNMCVKLVVKMIQTLTYRDQWHKYKVS